MRKQKTKRKRSVGMLAMLAARAPTPDHFSSNVLAEAAKKYRCRGKGKVDLVTANGFTVLDKEMAYRMLDNPPKPTEALLALLALH